MSLLAAATQASDPSWVDLAQVGAAVFAATAAAAIPLTAFWRRPSLILTEKEARRHSHLEANAPYLRLLVQNKARRRAARGTRVVVEGYRRQRDSPDGWVSMAHPALGWPSAVEATEGVVTIYSGSGRPVGLGRFVHGKSDPHGKVVRGAGGWIAEYAADDPDAAWHLVLTLHGELDILDDRDKLPPGEWVIRLLVGADDGDAQRYDVHLAWGSAGKDGATVLEEALDRLQIESA